MSSPDSNSESSNTVKKKEEKNNNKNRTRNKFNICAIFVVVTSMAAIFTRLSHLHCTNTCSVQRESYLDSRHSSVIIKWRFEYFTQCFREEKKKKNIQMQ